MKKNGRKCDFLPEQVREELIDIYPIPVRMCENSQGEVERSELVHNGNNVDQKYR